MWERSQLKEKAKNTFKRYYWKAVIVSFLAYMLTGGMGQAANSVSEIRNTYNNSYYTEYYTEEYVDESAGLVEEVGSIFANAFGDGLVLLFASTFMIVFILSLLIKLLIYYPFTIGKNNFFMGIREEEKPIKTLLFVYKDKKLKNIVITMFMREIFTYLWTLLLLIPGIIKSYEYRMIPYILSENPNISRKRAFEISKDMMRGNKWDTFILDLSFIGWHILSLVTIGLLSIFYVNPYVESTNAELYAYLRKDALEKGYADDSELIGF